MASFRASVAALTLVSGVTALAIQSSSPSTGAAEPLPAFEVASVRINKSGELNRLFRPQPGGRFDATNLRLRDLVQFAYHVRGFQIEGGPGWMDSTSFDIVAKAHADVPPVMPGGPPSPYMLMLRTLLADRFKLVVHRETRELPIYALMLAREDGTLGPNIAPASTDCAALIKAARAGGGPPPIPAGDRLPCGMRLSPSRLDLGGFPLTEFVNGLSAMLQRTVVNRTGLTGNYELTLTFAPEQLPGLPMPPPGAPAPAIDPNAPSIFTALQEQLGLKLESTRGPVEVLVIDRAEMPTED